MQSTHRQILRYTLIAGLLFAAPMVAQADSRDDDKQPCQAFFKLTMHLEVNATDNDGEALLLAQTAGDGIRSLVVVSPTGALVATAAVNRRTIGAREFILESTEPADFAQVLRSFPAGDYRVRGQTVGGGCVQGVARLSHVVAPTTEILGPAADDAVALDSFVLRWKPVTNAVSYIVTVDNETTGTKLVAESSASATSFVVPADWLESGNKYIAAVAVKTVTGNVTSVEIPVSAQ